MALNLDAAVKVRASVDGLGQLDGLSKSLRGVEGQAGRTGGALGKLRQIGSGLGGALGAILPAAGVAGLAAMGKQAIDAADNLNDLSQRTGVGVESLSKFGAAANDAGSSVDEVAKAMGKLARGVSDPASKINETLKSIGISSTDSRGQLRSLDSIMLDVADKFAKLPDGAQKTALAMELFGKSGANLIPMLNGGREAISQYSATIDTEMAKAADQFNDALNGIARSVAGPFNKAVTALLPVITQLANGIAGLAQWFSNLPGPVQSAIAIVAGLTATLLALAPAISALITVGSTLAGIFAGGGIFAALGTALSAVIPLITAVGTALSGLLPILVGIFTGPVGWVALLVAAGVAIYAFRDKIGEAFKAIGDLFAQGFQVFKTVFIDPIINAPQNIYTVFVAIFSKIGEAIKQPFVAALNFVKGIINSVLGAVVGAVNNAVGIVNNLIAGYNRLPTPDLPLIPTLSVPRFAKGGMVSGPTLAMVGEGGEPEYIVPQSKAAGFASNWMNGKRGPGAIPRFADGGMVTPSASINITTGPVMQQDGTKYVTLADMEAAMQSMAKTLLNSNRSYTGRRYQGVL